MLLSPSFLYTPAQVQTTEGIQPDKHGLKMTIFMRMAWTIPTIETLLSQNVTAQKLFSFYI
jgi:hypothetical protein